MDTEETINEEVLEPEEEEVTEEIMVPDEEELPEETEEEEEDAPEAGKGDMVVRPVDKG